MIQYKKCRVINAFKYVLDASMVREFLIHLKFAKLYFSVLLNLLTCPLKPSVGSIIIPRYLNCSTCFIFLPIYYSLRISFRFTPICEEHG